MITNDEIGLLKDVRRIGNTSDRKIEFVSVSVQLYSSLITFIHKLYIKDLNFSACLVKGSVVNHAHNNAEKSE
jgi:hypothetical protein